MSNDTTRLKPGTLEDFGNSMAEAMDEALERIWYKRMGRHLPKEYEDDRRMLFVAIAQGVVKHLTERADSAFDVYVAVTQATGSEQDAGPWIGSTGETKIGNSYYTSIVRQDQSAANKVKSTGTGTVTLLTTGEIY